MRWSEPRGGRKRSKICYRAYWNWHIGIYANWNWNILELEHTGIYQLELEYIGTGIYRHIGTDELSRSQHSPQGENEQGRRGTRVGSASPRRSLALCKRFRRRRSTQRQQPHRGHGSPRPRIAPRTWRPRSTRETSAEPVLLPATRTPAGLCRDRSGSTFPSRLTGAAPSFSAADFLRRSGKATPGERKGPAEPQPRLRLPGGKGREPPRNEDKSAGRSCSLH